MPRRSKTPRTLCDSELAIIVITFTILNHATKGVGKCREHVIARGWCAVFSRGRTWSIAARSQTAISSGQNALLNSSPRDRSLQLTRPRRASMSRATPASRLLAARILMNALYDSCIRNDPGCSTCSTCRVWHRAIQYSRRTTLRRERSRSLALRDVVRRASRCRSGALQCSVLTARRT